MNRDRIHDHRLRNLAHSVLLLGAMGLLVAWIGSFFFGTPGVTLALVAVAALLAVGRVSPHWVLRLHRAQPLSPRQAPELYRIVAELARRAELPRPPSLYLVPSPAPNAFAAGNADESVIGLTRGLLQTLDRRQLAGVLAHEISHVRHRDLWVMGVAQMLGQMTRSLSLFGQLLLLLSLPALLTGSFQVPLGAVLLLLAAPTVSALLQLALSRTREFEADLGAAQLTGDPLGLASALERLEGNRGGWWRVFFPVPRRARSGLLDSHPATAERVARLRSLVDTGRSRPLPPRPAHPEPRVVTVPRVVRLPEWTLGRPGYWHSLS